MKRRVIAAWGLCLLAVPAMAAGEEKGTPAMEEVVVTATRTAMPLDKVGGSAITVITAEQLDSKKQKTVGEVLKGVPGIDIKSNGGFGTNTTVHIRGADNKNTLVLVDGIMFNDPSQANRGANLGNLTTDNIERIEIVRGSMSVLYGSNATAGVINIITKKGEGTPSVFAGVEGGSYDSWKISGGSAGQINKLNYSLAASRAETDGFSIANDDNDRIAHDGNTSEDDGWKNTTLSSRLGIDISPDSSISTVIRYLDSEVELDDYGPGYAGDRFGGWPTYSAEPNGLKERRTDSQQLFGKINLHNDFLDDKFSSDFSVQAAEQERNSYDNDGDRSYDYDGEHVDVNWQAGFSISDSNTLSAGVGYFKEEATSKFAAIFGENADIISYWLQDQIFIGDGFDVVIGGRVDKHDSFGSEFTYRIAPAYFFDATQTTVKANYATGFRAPSLYELYSPYGNVNLEAEESEGWDLGIEQGLFGERVKLSVTYFQMEFTDRIDYDFAIYKYNQVAGKTKTKGIEASIGVHPVESLEFNLSYTYNDTEEPDGARLARRPLNKVFLNTQYDFLENALLSMDIYWVDSRDEIPYSMDVDGNPVYQLDSYTVVNLSARYDLNDNVELYGRIDNLFDEEYEEAWSYATPGLSAYLGIKMSY